MYSKYKGPFRGSGQAVWVSYGPLVLTELICAIEGETIF